MCDRNSDHKLLLLWHLNTSRIEAFQNYLQFHPFFNLSSIWNKLKKLVFFYVMYEIQDTKHLRMSCKWIQFIIIISVLYITIYDFSYFYSSRFSDSLRVRQRISFQQIQKNMNKISMKYSNIKFSHHIMIGLTHKSQTRSNQPTIHHLVAMSSTLQSLHCCNSCPALNVPERAYKSPHPTQFLSAN